MTTRVDITKALISSSILTFIKQMTVNVRISLIKPNTRLYAFFDGVSVDEFITPQGGVAGDPVITDAGGAAQAVFRIPAQTFKTGLREMVFLETQNYNIVNVYGSSIGFARTNFFSYGAEEKWQSTETTTKTITVQQITNDPNALKRLPMITAAPSSSNTTSAAVNASNQTPTAHLPAQTVDITSVLKGDPVAQTFFTFGITGGCFISSIELYFKTKDSSLPVWLELRRTKNGVPTEELVSQHSIATLNSTDVAVSDTAKLPTRFTFSRMIYLEQDAEFAFVVHSKSNGYLLWTSKIDERSVETQQIISTQPFNGSMYKSENNHTWLIEPTEDVKFRIYKAQFDTTVQSTINMPFTANTTAITSSVFQTLNSSSTIYANLPYKHGLDINSRVSIGANIASVYNGIPGSALHGVHTVSSVVNDYVFSINLTAPGAIATSTGPILTGGGVQRIQITNGGSGYSQITPPAVTLTGGGGSGFIGTAVVNASGRIVAVSITAKGSGYTTAPLVDFTFTGASIGTGAAAAAVITESLSLLTNRVYNSLTTTWDRVIPDGTEIQASVATTKSNYPANTNLNYTKNSVPFNVNLDTLTRLPDHLLLVSRENESHSMGNNKASELNLVLKSNNANVSPMLNVRDIRLLLKGNIINYQNNEVIESENSGGTVNSITLTGGGSGYSPATVVEIYGGVGSGATATCTVVAGSVTSVTITSPGSGYLHAPRVVFTPAPTGAGAVAATATTTISNFNSELAPDNGMATSRYLTKRQTLDKITTSARVFVEAYSNTSSSFEVYIKSSLSTDTTEHNSKHWVQLKCSTTRNRSIKPGEFKDYEFNVDKLPGFDVFTLKIVLRTNTPWDPPVLNNYRAILVA